MTFKPTDKTAMLKELAQDGTNVELEEDSRWTFGSGINTIGEGTTFDGHGATLTWPTNMGRLRIDHAPGVTIRNLNLIGWVNIHNVVSGQFTVEDVLIRNTLDGKTYLDIGKTGGATGAFNIQGDHGVTLRGMTFRGCISDHSYHHGFNMNLQDHAEGGGFADVLFEKCQSLSSGSGFEGDGTRDWSCGFDIPDAGDIKNMIVRDCVADDAWQDGFHLDGSWTGHRQNITDVLFERCLATRAGRRCSTKSGEKFWSGFYVPAGKLVDCRTAECRHAGFALKNEVPNSLVVEGAVDTGSVYGMILEYGAVGAKVEFTSIGATYRAFQGQVQGAGAKLDLAITNAPNVACTFGRTARVDFLDCTNHEADVNGKYANLGYTIPDGAVIIEAADDIGLEVWPRSRMNIGKIVWRTPADLPETKPPVAEEPPIPPVDDTTTVPPIVLPPDENTLGRLRYEDFAVHALTPDGRNITVGFVLDDMRRYFKHGTKYVPEGA